MGISTEPQSQSATDKLISQIFEAFFDKKITEKRIKKFTFKHQQEHIELFYKHRLILKLSDKYCAIKYLYDSYGLQKKVIEQILNQFITPCIITKDYGKYIIHHKIGETKVRSNKFTVIGKPNIPLYKDEIEYLTQEEDIILLLRSLKTLKLTDQKIGFGQCEAVRNTNGITIYFKQCKIAIIGRTTIHLFINTGKTNTLFDGTEYLPVNFDFECIMTRLINYAGHKATWRKGWLKVTDKLYQKTHLLVAGDDLILERINN